MTVARDNQKRTSTILSVAAIVVAVATAWVGVTREDAKTSRAETLAKMQEQLELERRLCRLETVVGTGDCANASAQKLP
jgi:hypothetical protein